MSDRAALVHAVRDHPDDDLPRRLFADWLDERGESPRAEFIRLQLDVAACCEPVRPGASLYPAALPPVKPIDLTRHERLAAQSEALREKYAGEWTRGWSAGLSDLLWHRGFVETATTSVGLFVQNVGRWLQHEPIRRWRLHSVRLMTETLARCPGLKYVSALEIDCDEVDLVPVIRDLAASRYVGGLRELYLPCPELPGASLRTLIASPKLKALRHVAPFSCRTELLDRYGWWTRRQFRKRFG